MIDEFANFWDLETFFQGAFNDERDFDEYLDDPETGVGEEVFDYFF